MLCGFCSPIIACLCPPDARALRARLPDPQHSATASGGSVDGDDAAGDLQRVSSDWRAPGLACQQNPILPAVLQCPAAASEHGL